MRRKYFLFVAVAALVALSWLQIVDDYNDRYTSKALTQASVTYGIARGINSLVSVLQSTEVSIGIASLSPGEFLDPLNDLIERFSWIAMMAMASLGFQKLLLLIASSLFFKILLTVTGLLFLYGLYMLDANKQSAIMRLFIVALFLRFAVSGVVFANNLVEHYFLETTKTEATQSLSETKLSLSDINSKAQEENFSIWGGIKDSLSSMDEEAIKTQTEKATNNILDLTVAYIAQAIIFPLVFLWSFYKILLWVWAFNWSSFFPSTRESKHNEPSTADAM